ncbi:Clr5 domain-containing protein [Xylariomycetidae sp. FL0641]|nr:Clr5 domain-containing protein [Xylariomycetidae sp. FL0641]
MRQQRFWPLGRHRRYHSLAQVTPKRILRNYSTRTRLSWTLLQLIALTYGEERVQKGSVNSVLPSRPSHQNDPPYEIQRDKSVCRHCGSTLVQPSSAVLDSKSAGISQESRPTATQPAGTSLGSGARTGTGLPGVLAGENGDIPAIKLRAPPKSNDLWEELKERITYLYIDEGMTLNQLGLHLEKERGFRATAKQYKSQLRRWGIRKNTKRTERREDSRNMAVAAERSSGDGLAAMEESSMPPTKTLGLGSLPEGTPSSPTNHIFTGSGLSDPTMTGHPCPDTEPHNALNELGNDSGAPFGFHFSQDVDWQFASTASGSGNILGLSPGFLTVE